MDSGDQADVEQLQAENECLLRYQATTTERFELMDAEKVNGYTITFMAQVLEVTRQGYYAWRSRYAARQAKARKLRCFDREVAAEFEASPKRHGSPRVPIALAKRGIKVDKKTVAKSMKRQGLEAISTRGFRHPGWIRQS